MYSTDPSGAGAKQPVPAPEQTGRGHAAPAARAADRPEAVR